MDAGKLKSARRACAEIKRLMKATLEALKGQGFIVSYEISRRGWYQ